MALDWTTLKFPFGMGLDTNTEEAALPVPRLVDLQNAVLDSPGKIRKRNGYTQYSNVSAGTSATPLTITTPQNLHAYKDTMVLFDGVTKFAWSSGLSKWVEAFQNYESLRTDYQTLVKFGAYDVDAADSAVSTDYRVTAYETTDEQVFYTVSDVSTGALIQASARLPIGLGSNASRRPRVVFNPSTNLFHIFFYDIATSGFRVKIIDATSSTTLIATVNTSSVAVTSDMNATARYDVVAAGSNGVFLAYQRESPNANVIRFGFVNSTGSLVSASTFTTVEPDNFYPDPINVTVDAAPNGTRYGVVYFFGNTTTDVYVVHLTWNGSTWATDATSGALDVSFTTPTQVALNASCIYRSDSTTLEVFYTKNQSPQRDASVKRVTYTSSGTATSAQVWWRHSVLVSKPVFMPATGTSTPYIVISFVTDLQTTYFLVNGAGTGVGGWIPAKMFPGTAYGPPNIVLARPSGSGPYSYPLIYNQKVDADTYNQSGIQIVSFTQNDTQAYQAQEVGESLHVAGGAMHYTAGSNAVETNFHIYPENTGFTPAAGGSMTPSVDYSYHVFYTYINEAGEEEISSFAGSLVVPMTAADTQVTLAIPTLAHTMKRGIPADASIAVYRSLANPGPDAPFYLVSGLDPAVTTGANAYVRNNTAADTVAFLDQMSDTVASARPIDYTSSGELDNLAPPSGHIMASGQGRVFIAGLESSSQIAYFKLHVPGQGLAFNDALTMSLDEEGGPITGMAMLNETLIVFKERRIYQIRGEGPNNLGVGDYFTPELISSETGCANQRSLVVTPQGLMFSSPTGRIYLLDQGRNVVYVGAPVEAFAGASDLITAATKVEAQSHVRFLLSEIASLVYDYTTGQWSKFLRINGAGACISQGVYHYVTTLEDVFAPTINPGYLRKEADSPTGGDDGVKYSITVKTGWINIAGAAGGLWQAIRRVYLLGRLSVPSTNLGTLTVNVAYNYDGGSTVETFAFPVITATGTTTLSEWRTGKLKLHKCDSIQFSIYDSPVSAALNDTIDLIDLTLEVSPKAGLQRLPASRTVQGA